MLNSHRYYISSEDKSETEGPEEGDEEAGEVVETENKKADEDLKSSGESKGGESEGVAVQKVVQTKTGN